jgi:hypothetical protein
MKRQGGFVPSTSDGESKVARAQRAGGGDVHAGRQGYAEQGQPAPHVAVEEEGGVRRWAGGARGRGRVDGGRGVQADVDRAPRAALAPDHFVFDLDGDLQLVWYC